MILLGLLYGCVIWPVGAAPISFEDLETAPAAARASASPLAANDPARVAPNETARGALDDNSEARPAAPALDASALRLAAEAGPTLVPENESLRELLAETRASALGQPAGSGAPGAPRAANQTLGGGVAPQSDPGVQRARELVRLYLNLGTAQPTGRGGLNNGRDTASDSTRTAGSLLEVALSESIGAGIGELITDVFQPSLEPDGYISFSIAGLGRFMLMLAGDGGGIRLVDLDSGQAVQLSNSTLQTVTASRIPQPGPAGNQPEQISGEGITLSRLIQIIANYLVAVITDPAFAALAIMAVLLWAVWRLRGAGI